MREASSRQEAVIVGQLLLSTDYIHHVVDGHHFEDGYLFFRFRQDGQLTNEATTYIIESISRNGPALPAIGAEGVVLQQ